MSELDLVLIRHAKTEQEGPPSQGDHGRRLTERGVSDAQAAGRWLIETQRRPGLVLCSTAVRAEQTWQAMAQGSQRSQQGDGPGLSGVEVWREPRVYNATAHQLLHLLSRTPEEVGCVVIVGHAPGIPDLAADLTDWQQAEQEAATALCSGYPTMTCAVLRSTGSADRAAPGSMALVELHTPRGEL
jgi:phosphohistidine phosphatase